MKIRGYALLAAGVAVGFVAGTRAGRERYEQMSGWLHRTSDELGVGDAVGHVADTAHAAAVDLRDTAVDRARDAVEASAQTVSEGLRSTADAGRS